MEQYSGISYEELATEFGYVPIGIPALVIGSGRPLVGEEDTMPLAGDEDTIRRAIDGTNAPRKLEYDAVLLHRKVTRGGAGERDPVRLVFAQNNRGLDSIGKLEFYIVQPLTKVKK